jgi:nucleoside 2-deoxyribosyltransferase
MKIYFAGSISGGRDDKEVYLKIISLLKNYGEVLTEHIGDSEMTSDGEDLPDDFIYERDMGWLRSSDVIVAEVSTPSLGVGYEIASALNLNKKIICLYREGAPKRVSSMLTGNKNLLVKNYKTTQDLPEILREFFQ